jgi:hypothetical protein
MNPSLEDGLKAIKHAISWKLFTIIIGRFSVEYDGRASSILEEGDRLLVIKQDRAILIHRPEGYKPVNWQPSGARLKASIQSNKLIIEAIRVNPREIIKVYFTKLYLIYASKLYDVGQFSMYLTEKDMQEIISKHPSLIEKGLKIIKVEKELEVGKADIVGRDREGNTVIIELKKHTITVQDVLQLNRYVSVLKPTNRRVRGIIVGTGINKDALEISGKLGLEYKILNLREISRYR